MINKLSTASTLPGLADCGDFDNIGTILNLFATIIDNLLIVISLSASVISLSTAVNDIPWVLLAAIGNTGGHVFDAIQM